MQNYGAVLNSQTTDGFICLDGYGAIRQNNAVRTTLLDTALGRMTSEESVAIFREGARYSDATLKKHVWVKRLYAGFCVAHGVEAWPLNGVTGGAFIRFCGQYAGYSVNSIVDVIL